MSRVAVTASRLLRRTAPADMPASDDAEQRAERIVNALEWLRAALRGPCASAVAEELNAQLARHGSPYQITRKPNGADDDADLDVDDDERRVALLAAVRAVLASADAAGDALVPGSRFLVRKASVA